MFSKLDIIKLSSAMNNHYIRNSKLVRNLRSWPCYQVCSFQYWTVLVRTEGKRGRHMQEVKALDKKLVDNSH